MGTRRYVVYLHTVEGWACKYHVRDDNPDDYFPLVVGNWWEYRPVGLPTDLIFKDRHEVVYQEGNCFFISHPKYAYWNGDKEDLEAILESPKLIVGDYHRFGMTGAIMNVARRLRSD